MNNLNVCLITLDAFRSDCSDKLLKHIKYGKIIFPNAYPRNIPTVYSFTSILNGVPVLTFSNRVGIQSTVPTLAEVLKNQGYNTLAFVDENCFLHPKIYGYEKGFDEYYYGLKNISEKGEGTRDAKRVIIKIKNVLEKMSGSFPSLAYPEELLSYVFGDVLKLSYVFGNVPSHTVPNTEKILSTAFTKIKKLDKKFFIFIHLLDTHYPYKFSKAFLEKKYGRDKAKKYWRLKVFNNIKFLNYALRYTFYNRKITPNELSKINREYYEFSTEYVSDQLNRFMEKVYDKFPNTLFVISSDHGDGFGEHGFYGHHWGAFHYQELLKVPLILIHPSFNKTRKIETNVSSLDIPPTILEFIGVSAKSTRYYLGRNVFDRKEDDIIICESFPMPSKPLPIRIKNFTAVRTVIMNNYKLTVNQHFKQKRLINLSKDPLEIKNVCNRYPLLAKTLEIIINKLEEHEQEIEKGLNVRPKLKIRLP